MHKIKLILAAVFCSLASSLFPFDLDMDDSPEDAPKVNFFNIGLDAYRFQETSRGYTEQKDKGDFVGAFFKFTSYKPFGFLSDSTDFFFTFEANYAQSGNVKRSGPMATFIGSIPYFSTGDNGAPSGFLSSYTPNYYDPAANRKQWVLELKGMGGEKLYNTDNWDLAGSLGLGFRMHKDTVDVPAPYNMTLGKTSTSYLYMPLGLSSQIKSGGLNLKVMGEFDWVFIATKKTGADYIFADDSGWIVESTGNDFSSHGIGYRLSADLTVPAGPVGITVSPYYRLWAINEYRANRLTNGSSFWTYLNGQDVQGSFPKTTTTEYGLQLSVAF